MDIPRRKDYNNGNEFENNEKDVDEILFRNVLQNVKTLVLDESDRLLELGFRRDIQEILTSLNNSSAESASISCHSSFRTRQSASRYNRQTLLFSATLHSSLLEVVDIVMATSSFNKDWVSFSEENNNDDKDYHIIDCIDDHDPTTHINDKTEQSFIVLPPERFWTGSLEIILNLITEKKKNKIIVFFEMTHLVQLYFKFLSSRLGYTTGVWEIHGKLNQRERTVVARRFRNASSGILLTSDVSARGVDYPSVSHVIQVGAPSTRTNYIHRIGRTARAGKVGKGLLILPESERNVVKGMLCGLKIFVDNRLQTTLLSNEKNSKEFRIRRNLKNELGLLQQEFLIEGNDPSKIKESLYRAYHSMISYYFQTRRHEGREQSSESSIVLVNQLIQDFGLPELPAIDFGRAKSLGIESCRELNVRRNWKDHNWHSNDGF